MSKTLSSLLRTVSVGNTTGTGNTVLQTSPTLLTSVITTSSNFDLLNTSATTVNFAGAATTVNIGALTTSTVYIKNDLQVAGNIYFNGTANQLSATNLSVNDSLIYLAANNAADIIDIGWVGAYQPAATHLHTGLVRDASDSIWKLFSGISAEPTTTVDFTSATYDKLQIGGLITTTVNGVSITTPSPVATTTLTLASGSTLATNGAFSITLTSTAATNVTLPTTGTLVNSAVTTLSSLTGVGTITSGTWSSLISTANDITVQTMTIGYGNGAVASNIAYGYQALKVNLAAGTFNTAIGYQTLVANTNGTDNTAIGYQPLLTNVGGHHNVAIGNYSLLTNISGNYNTSVGYNSLKLSTSSNNAALGYFALHNTSTGGNNTAIGYYAGYANSANANTTGSNNTYVGYNTVGAGINNTYELVIGAGAVGLGDKTTVIGSIGNTTATTIYGSLSIPATTDATDSVTGGTLTVSGGAAIAKKLFVGTDLTVVGTINTPTSAVSAPVWTTSGINLKLQARTYTDTSTAINGTVENSYINVLNTPTIASTNTGITITDAANLYVAAPAGGTNTTLTNAWSIFANGRVKATDFTGTIGATTASTGAFTTLTTTGTATIGANLTVTGNLIVNGNTTTVNSSTLTVDDKNIELGSVAAVTVSTTGTVGTIAGTGPWTATITNMSSTTGLVIGSAIAATNGSPGSLGATGAAIVTAIVSSTSVTYTYTGGTTPVAGTVTNITTTGATDATANLGGITLLSSVNKTIIWDSTNTNWTSSEHWNIATGKTYKINNVTVLDTAQVLASATGVTVGGTTTTTIALGTNTSGSTTATVGGAITGNILKIASVAAGSINLTTDVTTGTANIFTSVTGTISIGGVAASLNIGTTAGNSTLTINGNATTGIATLQTNTGVTTANVFNTFATTGNLFGAATTMYLGYTGTTAGATAYILTGAATAGQKTLNIGTGGTTGSTTVIAIGSTISSTTTINGTVKLPTVSNSTTGFIKTDATGQLSTDTSSYALTNQLMNIGTTSVAINRSSGALALTGITSIDGYAANLAGGNATTLLGAVPYQSNTNVTSLLTPNITATKKFLTQTGTGSSGAAPGWNSIANADVPILSSATSGYLNWNGSAFAWTALSASLFVGASSISLGNTSGEIALAGITGFTTLNKTAAVSTAIAISTGTTTTSGTTGAITLNSGNSAAASGTVTISTGTATAAASGSLTLSTGATTTSGATGAINIFSGSSSIGASGTLFIGSGDCTGASGGQAGTVTISPGYSGQAITNGSTITIAGGVTLGTTSSIGGKAILKGGDSQGTTTASTGGNVQIVGGLATSTVSASLTRTGGSVYIDGGLPAANTTGTGTVSGGNIFIGTQSIAGSFGTAAITIGTSSITTSVAGTLSASTLTVSSSLVVPSSSTLPASPTAGNFRFNNSTSKFEGYNGTAWGAIAGGGGGGAGTATAIKVGPTYTAVSGDFIRCDTRSSTLTVTFPLSPADGDIISIIDVYNTFATYNLILQPNTGKKIEGDTISFIVDINGAYLSFVYNVATLEWKMLETPSRLSAIPTPNPTLDFLLINAGII